MSSDNILNPYTSDDYDKLSNLEYLCNNIDSDEISTFMEYIYDSEDVDDKNNDYVNNLNNKIIELFKNIDEKKIDCYEEYLYFIMDSENVRPEKNINGFSIFLMFGMVFTPVESSGISLEMQDKLRNFFKTFDINDLEKFYNNYCEMVEIFYSELLVLHKDDLDDFINNGNLITYNNIENEEINDDNEMEILN